MRDREFLLHFHKKAKRLGVDVHEYNRLRESVAQVENDLRRLRDPLRIHYPHRARSGADEADGSSGERVLVATSLWDRANARLQDLLRSGRP